MLTQDQIDEWDARPKPEELMHPWITEDCGCLDRSGADAGCEDCDGFGWFYKNTETGNTVSELMRDAMERHG